jgi:hypothetical protein
MDSASNDITFNTSIPSPGPHSIITRNDAIKLIFVKLFSVSQNARCDTEVEKIFVYIILNKHFADRALCVI